jgi:hypothetical protein
MIFNNFNYQYYLTSFTDTAIDCIENDNLEGIQNLLETDNTLGCKIVYKDFEPFPVYQFALKEERDDIAYLLYMANPKAMKNTLSINTIRDITITSDILGDAVFSRRYELVEKLLNLQGSYKFDVNGFKNTCNMLNNCYFASTYDANRKFGFGDALTYVSSPFMISILMGDVKMYELIKKHKPYFNIDNKNCKFHFDNCKKAKIKDDLLIYF